MTKRIIALVVMMAIAISVCSICAFADDDIPSDLPANAVKIAEGIYMVDERENLARNLIKWVNIGTVPAFGTKVEPVSCSNIIVETTQRYLKVGADTEIRMNFVSGSHSVFGSSMYNWPALGGDMGIFYYIEADYYGIQKNTPYQLQCTSSTGSARNNVKVYIASAYYNQD